MDIIQNYRSLGAADASGRKPVGDRDEQVSSSNLLAKHVDYDALAWSWKKIRMLCAGNDVVKSWDVTNTHGTPGNQTFLLRPPGQTDEEYAFYVFNTRYFNAPSRTLDVLLGLFFYRDPLVYAPEGLDETVQNIDMLGSSLVDFAKKTSTEIMAVGRCGILVDYPRIPDGEGLTLAAIERKSIRPFLTFFYAEDIYNWEHTIINNVRTITRIVLRENHVDDSLIRVLELVPQNFDEFGVPTLWQYRSRLYELLATKETRFIKKGERFKAMLLDDVTPTMSDGSTFDYIPFEFAGLKYEQAEIQKPTLLDICDLTVDHYRKSADISSALFHCAHPTPIFSGFKFDKGQQVRLGAQQGISSTDSSAHASYLELNGQSITEIRKERDSVATELASLGARLLSSGGDANQTAETSRIKASGDTAVMNILASTMGQLMTRLLTIMAAWKGETGSISVDMNKEFMPYRMDSQDILALINGVVNNTIPIQDVLEAFKNGGVIAPSRTLKDYLADLASRPMGTAVDAPGAAPVAKPADKKTQGNATDADGGKKDTSEVK